MNKTLKKSLSVFLIIALFAVSVFQINAETVFTADGFSYTVLNDNFASICDWDGGSDTLSVPEKLNSARVKEIANRNTLNYLQENHYYIQQSHNQTAVINVLGASKQKSELEDRVLRRYGPLSSEDRRRVDEILDQGYY